MGINPLDDRSTAGQANHDDFLMLFHAIGHRSLADTKVDFPQNPGRVRRNKSMSCKLSILEAIASSQNCTDDVET